MDFGSVIKGVRQDRNLTQDRMGEMLGVSRQAVSNWENNRNLPDIEMLVLMAGVFGLSLDDLILGGKDMNNMTEKLISDGSEMRKTKFNVTAAGIGAALIMLGILCLVIKGVAFTTVDADGILQENTLLVLASTALLFGGFMTFLTVGVKALIGLFARPSDAGSTDMKKALAITCLTVFGIGAVLFALLVITS